MIIFKQLNTNLLSILLLLAGSCARRWQIDIVLAFQDRKSSVFLDFHRQGGERCMASQ